MNDALNDGCGFTGVGSSGDVAGSESHARRAVAAYLFTCTYVVAPCAYAEPASQRIVDHLTEEAHARSVARSDLDRGRDILDPRKKRRP